MFSNFCHNWQNHLDTSPRLAQYRKIKQSFEREFYLEVLFVDVYRNVFAQFRMGVSQLNVHRYRFSPSPENTNCPLCPNKEESEIHFLFECPLYNQIRQQFRLVAKVGENWQ